MYRKYRILESITLRMVLWLSVSLHPYELFEREVLCFPHESSAWKNDMGPHDILVNIMAKYHI